MTPFEEAGYTEDTKFKVIRDRGVLRVGDIVTLDLDDGTEWPYFKIEDGISEGCWLPNMTPLDKLEDLEVYEEDI